MGRWLTGIRCGVAIFPFGQNPFLKRAQSAAMSHPHRNSLCLDWWELLCHNESNVSSVFMEGFGSAS